MEETLYENPWFHLIPDIRRLLRHRYLCAMDRVALRQMCKRAAQEDVSQLNPLWPRAWMSYAQETIADATDFPNIAQKETYYAENEWINRARTIVLCSRFDDGPLLTQQPYVHTASACAYAIIWPRTAVCYCKDSQQWVTYASVADITNAKAVFQDMVRKLTRLKLYDSLTWASAYIPYSPYTGSINAPIPWTHDLVGTFLPMPPALHVPLSNDMDGVD